MSTRFDRIKEAYSSVLFMQKGEQVGPHVGDDFLRSGQILAVVVELLKEGTPGNVLLEIIDHLQSRPDGHGVWKIDIDTYEH